MDISQMKENKWLVFVIIAAIAVTGVFCFFAFRDTGTEEVFSIEAGFANVENVAKEESKEAEKIVVHVSGEVKEPGIVELNEGERIADAINKAGGATDDADLSNLNLAYVLEDGVKIRIPKKGAEVEEYVTESSGDDIIEIGSTEGKERTTQSGGMVNINKANQEELTTLPGIGEVTAKKIIEYRKENGNFGTIEDIQKVSGIGESKFNQIKSYIKVK